MSIEILLGDNAAGKTQYLQHRAKGKERNTVITNIGNTQKSANLISGYNEERLEAILLDSHISEFDHFVGDSLIEISDSGCEHMKFSLQFKQLVTLICRKGDYLYLDEPEYGLRDYECNLLVDAILHSAYTFKEVVVATHSSNVGYMGNSKQFLVHADSSVEEIKNSGVAYDLLYKK